MASARRAGALAKSCWFGITQTMMLGCYWKVTRCVQHDRERQQGDNDKPYVNVMRGRVHCPSNILFGNARQLATM